jgi:hypothetical protein
MGLVNNSIARTKPFELMSTHILVPWWRPQFFFRCFFETLKIFLMVLVGLTFPGFNMGWLLTREASFIHEDEGECTSVSSSWARRCTSHQTLGCRVFLQFLSLFFLLGRVGGWKILLVLTNVGHLHWSRQLASGGFSSNWGSTDQFILLINSSY